MLVVISSGSGWKRNERIGRQIVGLGAGPTLAGLYTLGLQLQGPWVGLPFLAVALICSFGAIGIWSFGCLNRRQPRERVPSTEEEDETALLVLPDSAEGGSIVVI